MKIFIGSDHAGCEMRAALIEHLRAQGHEMTDVGAFEGDATDYPIYGERVARAVAAGQCGLGILICGTGIGISLAANKVRGIRAAVCSEPLSASLARQHNDANVLCMGARMIGLDMAKHIADTFISTPFSGAERHARRIDMVMRIERDGHL